jgi:signal peptidase I
LLGECGDPPSASSLAVPRTDPAQVPHTSRRHGVFVDTVEIVMRHRRPRGGWGTVVFGLVSVAAATGLLLRLRHRYVAITVHGESMTPTYRPGDRVLVRRERLVRSGQCVVFAEEPAGPVPDWVLKRVVAVPGDPVPRDRMPALDGVPEARVPAGHLVVAGDNPAHSYDSRHHGYVVAERLLGVVSRRM